MEFYEYICSQCRKKFSEVLSVKEHDSKRVKCPRCKS